MNIGLTDGIELDATVFQVLWVEKNIVLGLSIRDQNADFARVWTHSYIGLKVVLEDVV